MARTVTCIPATIDRLMHTPTASIKKRRTAGYARVSTDSDEQFSSYEAQIDYYTKFIGQHPEWEFVKVYTDEGISGLNTRNREGFNEMIADALSGRIDLIVTKSVSRFARNTVDSLTTIRSLKDKGVEVFFEKENIWTFDGKGELLLTIMSSLAQEESRSISENVTWGQRKRFSDGKFSVGYSRFLGYEKGDGDQPLKIVPEQAETVRVIYKLFLEGRTTQGICNYLMANGIPSPSGKERWRSSTIMSILSNEKYRGDALLQKTYTADFLKKELRQNTGEVPQFLVEGSHEAIISPEEWDAVQDEIVRRKGLGRAYTDKAFHSKLICGDCGGFYGRKVWHSTDKYRCEIFRCNRKFDDGHICSTPTLTEAEIQNRFLSAYNTFMADRDAVIKDCELLRKALCDTAALQRDADAAGDEMAIAAGLMREHIRKNAEVGQDRDDYAMETGRIEQRYNTALERRDALIAQIEERKRKSRSIGAFIAALKTQPLVVDEWSERLWITVIDTATVMPNGRIVFRFKDGSEVSV